MGPIVLSWAQQNIILFFIKCVGAIAREFIKPMILIFVYSGHMQWHYDIQENSVSCHGDHTLLA